MGMLDVGYQGFWGRQSSGALEALADFLMWNKKDWLAFEEWLDVMERKDKEKRAGKAAVKSNRRALAQALHQLRYRGAVETKKADGRLIVRLTEAGWRRAQLLRITRITSYCDPGKCCLVVFDVPEKHRRVRNIFRGFLKECGFKQLQKSVWRSDRDVASAVASLVKELKLEEWVTVMNGTVVS